MGDFSLLDATWIETILRLPSSEAQRDVVQHAGLLNEAGLSQLLAFATLLARSNPGDARRLTTLCADLADLADLPALIPRATYLRAQSHAINGEFPTARRLIEQARAGYAALDQPLEAMRTNVGLMHVLNEQGHHQEALEAGDIVLSALANPHDLRADPNELTLLSALVNQNRGVCYEKTGRYEAALDAYTRAEVAFTKIAMQDRIGDIRNNRGIVLMHLGRASEALAAFEAAATHRAEAGLTLLQAQSASNIGEANLMLGHYTRSLAAFEEARRLFGTLDALAHQHILLRKIADAYLVLNLHPEALAAYQLAVELLKHAAMSNHLARAQWGLGATLLAQGRLEEAERALVEAATLFQAADNVPLHSSVMLEQAAVQLARGDRVAALATARQALHQVAGGRWPVEYIYAAMRVADLLLPDVEAAAPLLEAAHRVSASLGLPQIDYRLNRRLGDLHLLRGQIEQAQGCFERAVAQIEKLRGTLAQEAFRTSFLQDKTAAYERLMHLHLARGGEDDLRRAFAIAEQAKSRTLVDLLTGVIDGHAPPTSPDPLLGGRIQGLEAELHALYNQLLGDGTRGSLGELQERAVALEGEIRRLRLQSMGHAAPRDILATALAPQRLLEQLPPCLTMLAYHIVGDEILLFMLARGELRVLRHLSCASTILPLLQRLNVQWDRFRAGDTFAQRHLATLEQSARRVLMALFEELVAPAVSLLVEEEDGDGPRQVVIVPHGVLHQVPFHALHDGSHYLLDKWEISYAPSATLFALGQHRERRPARRGLVVGVPDALIPAVAAEGEAVVARLREASVQVWQLEGEAATLAALREAAPACDLLHVACHGLFRADNPMFSSLKLHDGWLTAADVMQLDLTGSLVTLSACESGRSQVILGDEVVGLPRAFLGAGAVTLVVSLWLVQDETTADLMASWYAALAQGVPPASALRAAQRALKQSHPHPYYWAAFVLIGKR